ncbi:hypothetical protein J6590_090734 [Homalodisca vitripennis]|nr:hypothetical protein J6590_090734 [Homalodisca vitripennis]
MDTKGQAALIHMLAACHNTTCHNTLVVSQTSRYMYIKQCTCVTGQAALSHMLAACHNTTCHNTLVVSQTSRYMYIKQCTLITGDLIWVQHLVIFVLGKTI